MINYKESYNNYYIYKGNKTIVRIDNNNIVELEHCILTVEELEKLIQTLKEVLGV